MNQKYDTKARMPIPRIGLLPTGHLYYWDQFPGLKEMCMNMHDKTAERLNQIGEVFSPGMTDTPEKASEAGVYFRNENVDILLILPLDYTTGMVVLPCARQMDVPIRILNIGNPNCRVKMKQPIHEFFNDWCQHGPSHHLALGTGDHSDAIEAFAESMKFKTVRL